MSGFRWTDEDGDEGEVIDWHEENPSTDEPPPPCAALRVRRAEYEEWHPVLLTKFQAAELIGWLTSFYGLAGTHLKRAVRLAGGDAVWADGEWLRVHHVALDEGEGVVRAYDREGTVAVFSGDKNVLVLGR